MLASRQLHGNASHLMPLYQARISGNDVSKLLLCPRRLFLCGLLSQRTVAACGVHYLLKYVLRSF
jgi:hypothetical protein